MRRPFLTLLTLLVVALALVATAAAGTPISMQPLRDAGYSVGVASQLDATCTVWSVSGHGVSEQINDCDPNAAATIASLDDPNTIYEADWQANHPDQLAAAQQIGTLCYSISRSAPMTDSWHIVGGTTDTTAAGADLPGLAATLPSNCGSGTGSGTVAVTPTTDGSGTTTQPGAASVTTAIAVAASAVQTAKLAASVTPTQVADASQTAAATTATTTGDQAIVALAARSAALDVMYGIDPAADGAPASG